MTFVCRLALVFGGSVFLFITAVGETVIVDGTDPLPSRLPSHKPRQATPCSCLPAPTKYENRSGLSPVRA